MHQNFWHQVLLQKKPINQMYRVLCQKKLYRYLLPQVRVVFQECHRTTLFQVLGMLHQILLSRHDRRINPPPNLLRAHQTNRQQELRQKEPVHQKYWDQRQQTQECHRTTLLQALGLLHQILLCHQGRRINPPPQN